MIDEARDLTREDYELIRRLGRGGMAEVYRAYNANLDRYEAIKVLHTFLADAPEFKIRFEKEARNIARLKHPHIVQVYDFDYDTAGGSYYMVMELIEGETLKDRMQALTKKGETMPLSEALRFTREAASALSYAHKQNMIHRDVKPANLMLDEDNRLVLTDFGIAKIVTGSQFTATGGMVGTPVYMAPEQGMGEAGDERSDLYSLGVILYELVTGDIPFHAETPLALILKHVNQPIPSACEANPKLPFFIDDVIAKLLAKNAGERYQTADELIATLDNLEHESQQSTQKLDDFAPEAAIRPQRHKQQEHRAEPIPPEPAPRSRLPALLFFLAVIGIIVIGGYAFGVSRDIFPPLVFLDDATSSPTATYTPSPTATNSPEPTVTDTPTDAPPPTATDTLIPTMPPPTLTATLTSTTPPTLTYTPTLEISPTPSSTPDVTQTLAAMQTATTSACYFDYAIIENDPPDGEEEQELFTVNSDYTREITFLNTGNCLWERNTSLTFIDGESFNAGPRIFIREEVNPGAEITVLFEGTLPSRGLAEYPIAGTWQLRTPGQIPIGEPFGISVWVYDPGS